MAKEEETTYSIKVKFEMTGPISRDEVYNAILDLIEDESLHFDAVKISSSPLDVGEASKLIH
jgi:hypothetical protein